MLEMLCKTWLTTRCFLLLRRSRQLSGAFNHALFICSYFFFFFYLHHSNACASCTQLSPVVMRSSTQGVARTRISYFFFLSFLCIRSTFSPFFLSFLLLFFFPPFSSLMSTLLFLAILHNDNKEP